MTLETLPQAFSVCQIASLQGIDVEKPFTFIAATDEEISLVCPSEQVPTGTLTREDDWRAIRIQGVLDFSLVGILANIARILAENSISIFAISTYNTDYILLKQTNFDRALQLLCSSGYTVA